MMILFHLVVKVDGKCMISLLNTKKLEVAIEALFIKFDQEGKEFEVCSNDETFSVNLYKEDDYDVLNDYSSLVHIPMGFKPSSGSVLILNIEDNKVENIIKIPLIEYNGMSVGEVRKEVAEKFAREGLLSSAKQYNFERCLEPIDIDVVCGEWMGSDYRVFIPEELIMDLKPDSLPCRNSVYTKAFTIDKYMKTEIPKSVLTFYGTPYALTTDFYYELLCRF